MIGFFAVACANYACTETGGERGEGVGRGKAVPERGGREHQDPVPDGGFFHSGEAAALFYFHLYVNIRSEGYLTTFFFWRSVLHAKHRCAALNLVANTKWWRNVFDVQSVYRDNYQQTPIVLVW